MNATPEFTDAQAELLIRFLAAPARPERTFRYQEAAGFLFAIACVPEAIPVEEWLPLIFDDEDANYADAAEEASVRWALMALFHRIAGEVERDAPTLPPRCEPLADPVANFGSDAPLGLWASGFGAGHDWLEEAWPENLPQEADEFLGVVLVTLTFFESRELAESYMGELGEKRSMEEWAADMLTMFPDAMRGYAELARAVMGQE